MQENDKRETVIEWQAIYKNDQQSLFALKNDPQIYKSYY